MEVVANDVCAISAVVVASGSDVNSDVGLDVELQAQEKVE